MAEALYRKYRPQIFEDVVGQEHIERTIKNAIEQDKVSHAYLFTGPRGTGKTTTARLLAKALLCECGPTPEPDGTCDDCVMIANGEHPDVYELDAAPEARAGLRHTSVRGRGGSVRRRLRLVRADARACSGSSFGADACCRPGSRGSGSGGCSHVGDARACGAAIARRAAGHSGRRFRRWRARRRSERIARQLVRRTYAACSKRP